MDGATRPNVVNKWVSFGLHLLDLAEFNYSLFCYFFQLEFCQEHVNILCCIVNMLCCIQQFTKCANVVWRKCCCFLSAQWGGSSGIEAKFLGPLFLQCFDTVGWVFWPIKPVPDMTYNVFGGTLNLAQFNSVADSCPDSKYICYFTCMWQKSDPLVVRTSWSRQVTRVSMVRFRVSLMVVHWYTRGGMMSKNCTAPHGQAYATLIFPTLVKRHSCTSGSPRQSSVSTQSACLTLSQFPSPHCSRSWHHTLCLMSHTLGMKYQGLKK